MSSTSSIDSHDDVGISVCARSTNGAWLSSCSTSERNLRRVACLRLSPLLTALSDGLDITPRKTLVSVADGAAAGAADGLVEVRFEDGTRERGSLLVGADGVGSAVRSLVFPEARLRHAGELCFAGFIPADLAAAAGPRPFETIGRGEWGPIRMAVVPLAQTTAADAAGFWFATVTAREVARGAREAPGWEGQYGDWHEPVPAILAAARRPGVLPPARQVGGPDRRRRRERGEQAGWVGGE
jgi:2-polyprenyl-6-methoxyphenol hydroxylase-like FAD-dependent oxidoreductase